LPSLRPTPPSGSCFALYVQTKLCANPRDLIQSAVVCYLDAQLTFMPNSEALRLGSALIMGIAVCATHYSGMGAASYTASTEDYAKNTRFLLHGKSAAEAASNGALLTCYWFASFSVVRSARVIETSIARGTRVTANQSGVSVGYDPSVRNAPDEPNRTFGSRRILVAASPPTAESQV
jgi:hypothetical protein